MSAIKVVCCYAREDQRYLNELRAHLKSLERQGLISIWSDTDISPGTPWEEEEIKHLTNAQLILLFVSRDFLNSEYCYSKELVQAVKLHERGKVKVIPIILRHVDWQGTPFAKLQVLPTNTKPVVNWRSRDAAYEEITKEIRKLAIQEQGTSKGSASASMKRFSSRKPVENPLIPLISQQFRSGDRLGDGIVRKSRLVNGSEIVEVQFKRE